MRGWTVILMTGLCFVVVACSDAPSVESERPASVPVSVPPPIQNEVAVPELLQSEVEPPVVSYNGVGRRDPFRSIVALSENRPKSLGALPPLQRNEISDLRLQGIILGSLGPRAIVNTPDGKGYTVRIGTQIGFNHGVITRITQNKVVIEETLLNIFGEPKKRTVVMELHPQEEG
ncbi:MAG: pilus assembly protein PilP [Nitrospiria bacterium]